MRTGPCPERCRLSSPQIIVRQLPDEVHRALTARTRDHGHRTEAEVRDIIARAVLPETRPQAGDILCSIWEGADVSGVTFERDRTAHNPVSFD